MAMGQAILDVVMEDYLKIIAGIIPIALTCLGVYLAARNYRLNKRNAAKVPELTMYAFRPDIRPTIYVVFPYDGETIFATPIQFVVGNAGTRSAKGVKVFFEVSDSFYLHNISRQPDRIATAQRIEIASDEGRNEHVARVYYGLSDISPRTAVQVSDVVFSNAPTVRSFSVPVVTKDNVQAVVEGKYVYGIPVTSHVLADDIAPIAFNLTYHFRQGSWDELEKVAKEESELIQAGSQTRETEEITIIAFKNFSARPDVPSELKVLDARLSSIHYTSASLGPDGLKLRHNTVETQPARE